ncbi:MAG: hypothetical protein NVS4B3_11550 [Gemmatimonadaceae bacterium]
MCSSDRKRRLLCFTKSSGFEHSVVRRPADGSLSLVERTITSLGDRNGFGVTCTKDGSVFTTARLREFDAVFFYTTGDLTVSGTDRQPPMPPGGKDVLLQAIRSGTGFVGVHSASDTFHTQPDTLDHADRYAPLHGPVDPYIAMLGGEFITHGKIQPGALRIWDAGFPGAAALGGNPLPRVGEWYSLRSFAPDMHVIMTLDTSAMTGSPYARGAYPVTWARRHGRGHVFYTALGHLEAEWQEPALPGMLVSALRWAFGDATAHLTRNLASAAPRYAELPPRS